MAQKEISYQNHTFPLSYEILNPSGKRDILFLHGWGSNKEIMKQAFASRLPDFRHIYVDMPGFGKSPNEMVFHTRDYHLLMELFIDTLGLKKDIIVGHSFGGKVATLLDPDCLVLLSSAGIPVKKAFTVRLKIALFKLLKKLGLGRFYRLFATKDAEGMPRNMYETLKNVVDEDFSKEFSAYHGKGLIFWGKRDTATPLHAGKQIASLIKNSRFFPMEGDHYFFLKHAGKIADTINSESVA